MQHYFSQQPPMGDTDPTRQRSGRTRSRRRVIIGGALLALLLVVGSGVAVVAAQGGGAMPSGVASLMATGHAKGKNAKTYVVTGIKDGVISASQKDGSAVTITTTSKTVFEEAGQQVTRSAVTVGARIRVKGKAQGASSIDARTIVIVLPHVRGLITTLSSSSITLQDKNKSITVMITAQTRFYNAQTHMAIALGNIYVGEEIVVEGVRNSDGSLTAARVVVGRGIKAMSDA